MSSRGESVASARIEARRLMLLNGFATTRVTDAQKAAIIALVEHGATLVEIERMIDMPSASTIWRECSRDQPFAEALRLARVVGAATILDEAQDQLRQALETNDPETMRVAADYAKGSTVYAEKIAPKEFGQLVKHAGIDGGAMVVQTIQYSQAESRSLDAESESPARGITTSGTTQGDASADMGALEPLPD